MFDARRPKGRLFYLTVAVGIAIGLHGSESCAASYFPPMPQSGPPLTTVSDTVYRADGTPAQGTLVITWPAFVTAGGVAVAAGRTNATLTTQGRLNVALASNAGSNPAGVYYVVVYQLSDNTVKTEFWSVPTSSPATLATVRTTPGSGTAAQPVSMQYVNTALATKANDSSVVHLSGSETISGAKIFSAAPNVPAPVNTGDVANKAYVDTSVANVGAGNFLALAGGAMTGPLTLSGNPATLVAPASVLFDGVIPTAPAFCTYALVNAVNMQCSIAYTYATHISLAEVRTVLPNQNYVTQLVGPLLDGAACQITSNPSLDFYPQDVPALNQLIVVSYRGQRQAVAQVENAASIAALQNGSDNGVRGAVLVIKTPDARTGADCENAALAILDDATGAAWSGTYETWSDFLPGGAVDIFPGDALVVNAPSRGASFTAVVREVAIELADPAGDRGFYTIAFANDLAAPLGIQYQSSAKALALQDVPPLLTTSQVGGYYVTDITGAQISQVTSTTVQIDAGVNPGSGFGIEVREQDFGWGQANDRNLLGRFNTQSFSLPRLARTQNYFLRLYDGSSPPRYSRHSAALHIDYPL